MPVSVTEAGKKGGLIVLNKYGREFYRSIGRKGQKAMRKKYVEWRQNGVGEVADPRRPKHILEWGSEATYKKGGCGSADDALLPHQGIMV